MELYQDNIKKKVWQINITQGGEGNNGYIENLEVCDFNDMDGTCGVFQMTLYKASADKYY